MFDYMALALIDRHETLNLFDQFMNSQSELRIMRLIGEAKFGKTHLVTRIFPDFVRREFQATYCVIDLRNKAQEISDILHNIYRLLGGEPAFPHYYSAYTEWLHRPKVHAQGIRALFSSVKISSTYGPNEHRVMIRELTDKLVNDLQNLSQNRIVLLFDTVEQADEYTQAWLIDNLLVQLAPMRHIRVVLAGRSVPEPAGNYAINCWSYELLPVRDEEAYILYCKQVGAILEEQSIRDIAQVLDYNPGLFVDRVIPKYTNNR